MDNCINDKTFLIAVAFNMCVVKLLKRYFAFVLGEQKPRCLREAAKKKLFFSGPATKALPPHPRSSLPFFFFFFFHIFFFFFFVAVPLTPHPFWLDRGGGS